ncbi:MAG: glycosyl transferase [Ekhidna sp.]
MSNKKILLISYYWPPSGGVGVQRWMNFALQLKNNGWDVNVLTPENPQFDIQDEKLRDRVKSIVTFKVPIWEPFSLFHKLTGNKNRENSKQGLAIEKTEKSVKDLLMIWIRGNIFLPDPRIFWMKEASKKAIQLVQNEGISTIITTGPPHSMHLIGRRVKRKTGVKWLADFRDPWVEWDVLRQLKTSQLAYAFHRKWEKSVLKESDIATTVSPRLAQSFGNIEVLNNGITVKNIETTTPDQASFTIGYFGMLNELRNPTQLWLLLDQMCRENEHFSKKLKVRIGGIVAEPVKQEVDKLEFLRDKVEFLGYLSHESLQSEYSNCNVLLLLLNKTDNSKWSLPIKFFEYLGAKRSILCLGERKSDLGDILNDKDIGEILGYSEVEDIRIFLEEVFEGKRIPNENDSSLLLKEFSHENQVLKLEGLLSSLH